MSPVRVSPLHPACLLLLLSQGCCLAAEEPAPDPAYIAELSDRRLLMDAFDSDAWEALVRSRTALKDYVRAREALQIWRRNMAKKDQRIAKIDQLEAALEDAQGNHFAAINARLRFLQTEPKNLQIWTDLFFNTPGLTEAAEASEAAAKMLSVSQFCDVWKAVVEGCIAWRDLTRAGAALELWRQGLRKFRATSPQLDRLQGDVDWAEGRQREAVQSWNKSLSGDSKNVSLLDKLLVAHEAMGSVSEGLEVATRLLKLGETAPNYCRRANFYILKREWKDARADVLKANTIEATSASTKRLYPVFEGFDSWFPTLKSLEDQVRKARGPEAKAVALLERTKFFVHLGFFSAAYEDAAEASKTNPSSVAASLWLGACANQTGRTLAFPVVEGNAEALLKSEAALRDLDGLSLPQKFQRLLDLGQKEVARAFLRKSPGNDQVGGGAGRGATEGLLESEMKMYESAGRTTDLRFGKALQRLVELEPDRADLWIGLGKYQLAQGHLDEALECAAKAETKGAGEPAQRLIKAVGERRILP
jgi:tetratricopeptide (TPR) repeat protein